jgi:hypothetical protein
MYALTRTPGGSPFVPTAPALRLGTMEGPCRAGDPALRLLIQSFARLEECRAAASRSRRSDGKRRTRAVPHMLECAASPAFPPGSAPGSGPNRSRRHMMVRVRPGQPSSPASAASGSGHGSDHGWRVCNTEQSSRRQSGRDGEPGQGMASMPSRHLSEELESRRGRYASTAASVPVSVSVSVSLSLPRALSGRIRMSCLL